MFVSSVGEHVAAIEDDASISDLKPLVFESTGKDVRRIGRFTQLALIGAGRCAHDTQIDPGTSVYIGSSQGDLETIIDLMRASLRDGRAPKPLSFVNTVSNATCYYVAQTFGLLGRSTFLCNRYFAFESALQLAMLDLTAGEAGSALIGAVDMVIAPLAEHRTRLGLEPTRTVAEASHWLLATQERTSSTLCRVLAARSFTDRAELDPWLDDHRDHRQWGFVAGQYMGPHEASAWRDRFEPSGFDDADRVPHYDTRSAAIISRYVKTSEARPLLHINCDPSGRYSVLLIDRG